MKISFLLLLCLASFIMNFSLQKEAISHAKEDAKSYDKTYEDIDNSKSEQKDKKQELDKTISNLEKKNTKKYENVSLIKSKDKDNINDNKMKNTIEKFFDKESKTYLFKLNTCDPFSHVKRITDFVEEIKLFI